MQMQADQEAKMESLQEAKKMSSHEQEGKKKQTKVSALVDITCQVEVEQQKKKVHSLNRDTQYILRWRVEFASTKHIQFYAFSHLCKRHPFISECTLHQLPVCFNILHLK